MRSADVSGPVRTEGAAPARATDGAAPLVSERPRVIDPSGPASGPERPRVIDPSGPASGPERSGPVSMQPSGPVPKLETVAAGSGPHDDAAPERRFGVPASNDEALRMWDAVLDEVEQQRRAALAALYRHARVLRWTADQLELGFPVETHDMGEMARDSADELRAIVRALGPELKNLKVAVRLLDASESNASSVRSVLEDNRERTSAERTRREAEAREHPITKHVLQTFGAQIKEIKTDV